jgi:1-acyl-sn-glycerol-3-phosphate acyltransferase
LKISDRHVSWMTAAKSFHRKDIGGFARALKCIPVVRPEDNESKGAGFITTVGTTVKGTGGTRFTQDFAKGSIIVVKDHKEYGKLTGKVSEVISDTEMVLAGSMQGAPLEKSETATEKEEKSYNRAMSVRTTLLMVMAIYYPLYKTLLPFFPDHWWPLVHMISFQLACWSTNVVYHVYRSEDAEMETLQVTALAAMRYIISRPEPARGMSQSGSGDSLSSTHTPSSRSMKRSKSLSQFANTDHSTDQKAKPQEEESTKIARDISEPMAYTYLPFVDQSDMFENVYDHLGRGGTIGIFPEGGTHDGTKLLPLKWGISTMVLGAMAKYEGREPLKISVVPVGLNYFNPHKFRSSVSVDFGDPIEFDQSIVEMWKKGGAERREANSAVMELVVAGMRNSK